MKEGQAAPDSQGWAAREALVLLCRTSATSQSTAPDTVTLWVEVKRNSQCYLSPNKNSVPVQTMEGPNIPSPGGQDQLQAAAGPGLPFLVRFTKIPSVE